MADRIWLEIEKRLANAEGHLRGIGRMAASREPCPEIARQLLAVRGSLDHLVVMVLDAHLSGCVLGAVARGDVPAGEAALRELLDILRAATPNLAPPDGTEEARAVLPAAHGTGGR